MIKEAADRVSGLVANRHVLCLQDTTEVNLTSHDKRIKDKTGLGRLDSPDYALGFKMHPAFVLDGEQLTPLGFSDIKLWHRPLDMADRFERKYNHLPIVEKESYKWIEVAQRSKEVLKQARTITIIQDRESDIYEVFNEVPNEKTHLVIRSSFDRRTIEGRKLSEILAQQPCMGSYSINLQTDLRKNRTKGIVNLEVRFCQTEIRKPPSCKTAGSPASIPLYVVEARQEDSPKGQKGVYWRLLTTHQVSNMEDAIQVLEWYSCRWYVEQVFRLLKHKGFQIEQTELESGGSIRKLAIIMFTAILKIIQMRLSYDDENEGQPIEEVYDQQEVECLKLANERLQGKTQLLQNKYNPTRTQWATWVIARIGGWSGYESQGPPGLITLKKGMERFSYMLEGFLLAKDMGTR